MEGAWKWFKDNWYWTVGGGLLVLMVVWIASSWVEEGEKTERTEARQKGRTDRTRSRQAGRTERTCIRNAKRAANCGAIGRISGRCNSRKYAKMSRACSGGGGKKQKAQA